jgi:hypothetical protein
MDRGAIRTGPGALMFTALFIAIVGALLIPLIEKFLDL